MSKEQDARDRDRDRNQAERNQAERDRHASQAAHPTRGDLADKARTLAEDRADAKEAREEAAADLKAAEEKAAEVQKAKDTKAEEARTAALDSVKAAEVIPAPPPQPPAHPPLHPPAPPPAVPVSSVTTASDFERAARAVPPPPLGPGSSTFPSGNPRFSSDPGPGPFRRRYAIAPSKPTTKGEAIAQLEALRAEAARMEQEFIDAKAELLEAEGPLIRAVNSLPEKLA